MQAACPHCGHVQTVEEETFGGREIMQVACGSCGKPFQVFIPRAGSFKAETTRHAVESLTSEVLDDGRKLRLPQGRAVSIKVLEGEDKGSVYPVLKPRVTLGRSNSDIIVNDPLSSRIHCAIEFTEEGVLLRDLGSTNGTLVDHHSIHVAEIADGSTFQIGRHLFQLRIAAEES